MNSPKFMLVHPYGVTPQVSVLPDRNCPTDEAYFLEYPIEGRRYSILNHKMELRRLQAKYDNALKGLQYWKGRASK